MTQFLPPNLLALFAARDPIPYLPPAAKLPHEKKQKGYDGVGAFLSLFEHPSETPPPTRVETREERLERRRRERAEQTAYKLEQEIALWDPTTNPRHTGDPFKTLFVARVNYDTSESKLRREFEGYGAIKKIHMVFSKENSKPRGYAFIEYEHERDMHSAYKHADGKKIDGKRVLVDVERARTVKGWLPRRLGGGLGGTRRGGADVNIKHSGREDNERERERYRLEQRDRDDRQRHDRALSPRRRGRRGRGGRRGGRRGGGRRGGGRRAAAHALALAAPLHVARAAPGPRPRQGRRARQDVPRVGGGGGGRGRGRRARVAAAAALPLALRSAPLGQGAEPPRARPRARRPHRPRQGQGEGPRPRSRPRPRPLRTRRARQEAPASRPRPEGAEGQARGHQDQGGAAGRLSRVQSAAPRRADQTGAQRGREQIQSGGRERRRIQLLTMELTLLDTSEASPRKSIVSVSSSYRERQKTGFLTKFPVALIFGVFDTLALMIDVRAKGLGNYSKGLWYKYVCYSDVEFVAKSHISSVMTDFIYCSSQPFVDYIQFNL